MGIALVWLSEICSSFRRFLSDDRGTAGLEFVTASPLLFGVLVFTAEYGQALRARLMLEGAVQDAARYLARAPADKGANDANGIPQLSIYPQIRATARQIVFDRVGDTDTTSGSIAVSVNTVDGVNFRNPYYVINVTATVSVDLPLLSMINIFSARNPDGRGKIDTSIDSPNALRLTMTATRSARWTNGAPLGEASCLLADRYQGLCP